MRNHRDCHPRSSESPKPGESVYPVEGYDTPEPGHEPPEVIAESNKMLAEEAYHTLLRLGGRSTRPIRPVPPWKKVAIQGDLCYRYAEEVEVLFHSAWHGNSPGLYSSLTEADYMMDHWGAECRQFREELRRWQDFLDTQQWRRDHRPEFAKEEDMERQRYPHDPQLTASLKSLKDWKEYQVYFQRGIDRGKDRIEWARQEAEAMECKDSEVVATKDKARGRSHKDWLRLIERQHEWVAAEEKRSKWANEQLPAVLSECIALLRGTPASLREMELRSEFEAREVCNTLLGTGGRPTRPIRPVPNTQEHDYTDKHFRVLSHWQGECSYFEKELREWKKFLAYRQARKADLEERPSAETPEWADLWKDYRAYQQLEVENAKQWIQFWQRQVKESQETEDNCVRQGNGAIARRYHSEAEEARSHINEVRKLVRPAKTRLRWIEQVVRESTSDCPKKQAERPKRQTRSLQTTLVDLKAGRSDNLVTRSGHHTQKSRASTNFTLSPIHPSRVSKAAKRKAPSRQPYLKTLAEHSDRRSRGPDTTISPLIPADITLRRSSRLLGGEKRAPALETSLATDWTKSTRSPSTISRRKDQISKQKTRKNPLISKKDASQCPSRPKTKGLSAGTKSDTSSIIKPRGISKRQKSNLSYK